MNQFTKTQEEALRAIIKLEKRTFQKGTLFKADGITKINTNTLNALVKKDMLIKEGDYYTAIEPRFNEFGYYFLKEVREMREINVTKNERELSNKWLDSNEDNIPDNIFQLLKKQINKKGGILYDEYKEDVYIRVNEDGEKVYLKHKDSILNGITSDCNFLLEGDNYFALEKLKKIYPNGIDVICIDPPYNTENKEFTFNDKMIGEDDSYRHSKWLSFFKERIKIAKELLKEDGVVFINLDDHEQARAKIACEDIFGEKNIELMIWQKVGDGNAAAGKMKTTNRFRIEHEYIIVCYKNKDNCQFKKYFAVPEYQNEYKNLDNDPRGPFKAGNMSKTEEKSNPNGKNYFSVISPDGEKTYTRQWSFSQEEIINLQKDKRIYWGKSGHGVPQIKIFINEPKETTPTSILLKKGSASMGSSDLKDIFNTKKNIFDNPKPNKLIKYLLNLIPNKDAIVLDFFAGSGTTGQAVLELNQEDGGNRKFILCTNNENNICEKVTYPRLKTVITGIREDGSEYSKGISANLIYDIVDATSETIKDEIETEELKQMSTITIIKTLNDLNNILDNLTSELKVIYLDDDFDGLNEDERQKFIENGTIILNDN